MMLDCLFAAVFIVAMFVMLFGLDVLVGMSDRDQGA